MDAPLTFNERVAHQYAIEEVYWRHRIWPKENPSAKPALSAVISRGDVEKTVLDYLQKCRDLQRAGHTISSEQLQAEMERMASQTQAPDVLRELFAALGNDAYMIAECLARPITADHLSNRFNIAAVAASTAAQGPAEGAPETTLERSCGTRDRVLAAYKLPEVSAPSDCTGDAWATVSIVGAPDARCRHSAVWTGTEMIIWGGENFIGSLNTGARYTPSTDSWTATATAGAPLARGSHLVVWTGFEMMVWGGYNYPQGDLNSGGKYNPNTNTWTTLSSISAPEGREDFAGVWTGNGMIVWGGAGCTFGNCILDSGGTYDPRTDRWAETNRSYAPVARFNHTAVWTGSEMIVWGGSDNSNYLRTGGRYNPLTDTWTATVVPPLTIPGRTRHTAVWSGREMIVWGGVDEFFHDTNTGGRYDPRTDSWMPTEIESGAPSLRDSHTAVWTGSEMIIWGGSQYPPGTRLNNGARYNPGADSWAAMTTVNAPMARADHTAVWTGREMIVWGGVNNAGFLLNSGGRYCVSASPPLVQSVVSRRTHGAQGSFDLDLPLGGAPGVECRSGAGPSNDYTIVVTFSANVSVQGNPQASIVSGSATIGSGGMSNGGAVITAGNVVTLPLTNVANAQTISVQLNGVNGSTGLTIPMSLLVGDSNGDGSVNAADAQLVRGQSGAAAGAANFRADVNCDGTVNIADAATVRAASGSGLP